MQDIQSLLDRAVEFSGTAGAQLSVVRKGEQIDVASGFRDHGLGIPMTIDTNVQVGSVTKVLNAALVLELAAAHGLDIDDPIVRYLPNLKLSDPEAAARITLRHLLSMSSGLDNGDYGDYGMDEDALKRRIQHLENCPQHFAPGEAFGYSNASTDLSGYVAQVIAGRPWDDLLQEFVVGPLNLRNTASRDPERHLSRLSRGHVFDPGNREYSYVDREYFSAGSAPAGSTLTSTAQDLATFGQALLKGHLDASHSVFAPETVRGMFQYQVEVPVKGLSDYWCLGLAALDWEGTKIWWHSGGNLAGASFLFIIPDQRCVLACAFNTKNVAPQFHKALVDDIFPSVVGIGPRPPLLSDPAVDEPDKYCGSYGGITGDIEVQKGSAGLHMKARYAAFGLEEEGDLIPIDGQRFWIKQSNDESPTSLYKEIAFFGADEAGRTMNAIYGYFAYSRAHSGRSKTPPFKRADQ